MSFEAELVTSMKALLHKAKLTTYENTVVSSLIAYYEKNKKLSDKQITLYSSIDAKYSDREIEKRNNWLDSVTDEMRETLLICAHYYKELKQYYFWAAKKVVDEGYMTDQQTYEHMCNNKFALSVIEQTRRQPLYEVGQIVHPSSKCGLDLKDKFSYGGVVLAANNEPVISHAKGSKRYLILPIGSAHGITVEERWMKVKK